MVLRQEPIFETDTSAGSSQKDQLWLPNITLTLPFCTATSHLQDPEKFHLDGHQVQLDLRDSLVPCQTDVHLTFLFYI